MGKNQNLLRNRKRIISLWNGPDPNSRHILWKWWQCRNSDTAVYDNDNAKKHSRRLFIVGSPGMDFSFSSVYPPWKKVGSNASKMSKANTMPIIHSSDRNCMSLSQMWCMSLWNLLLPRNQCLCQRVVMITHFYSRLWHWWWVTRTPFFQLTSSLFLSTPQEEAHLHSVECARDDAAGRAAGDPQRCQRLRIQQCPHFPGTCSLCWHPHHLGGALHQPGFPTPCHDHLQLVLRESTEAKA